MSPLPPPLPPSTAPPAASLPHELVGTAPATGKKRTRGPDKQPRKKKTQTQKGKSVAIVAEKEDTMAEQRRLAAAREAAVDKDVAAGDW